MNERILINNIDSAKTMLDSLCGYASLAAEVGDLIGNALTDGNKLLTCGNGGSAADAAHMTTEFVGRFITDRRSYPALCLAVHGGDITAIGNDYDFNDVFARQIQAFGQEGDVLLAISSSGKSENIRRALLAARDRKLITIALLGRDGGFCRGHAGFEFIVESDHTARIQEGQKLLIHTLCDVAEKHLLAAEAK